MSRPSWDEMFLGMAGLLAQRSVCLHYQVGAVIARGNRFLSGGYNGPPAGEVHCSEVGCAKEVDGKKLPPGSGKCRGAHAELNAIANAAREGVKIEGAEIFVTYRPCYICAKTIINAGIKTVTYEKDYDGDFQVFDLFQRCRVTLRKLENTKLRILRGGVK